MSKRDHNVPQTSAPAAPSLNFDDQKQQAEIEKLKAEVAAIKTKDLGCFAKWERGLKVVAALLVPLVIAWFGWRIQTQVPKNAAAQEYVKTAVGILATKSGTNVEDQELRSYAIGLLDAFSPVKVPASLVPSLTNGTVRLPAQLPFVLTDEQGRVITDENGNPIGVNPPPGATTDSSH